MKIHLICQASLLVECAGVRILTDPWFEGRTYGDAWELCPPPLALPDLRGIDALFISHAHPDHFNARTLESLLPIVGGDVPVLIPKLFFPGMRDGLRALGFRRVVEMVPDREIAFKGLRLFSQQYRMNDSLLVIRGDETLIDLNDCPVRGSVLRALARRFPKPDYVFAQFSVAQAYPYCYEDSTTDWDKDDLIERFDNFARVLQPRAMVPFASFVRSCNADNQHMNAHRTSLQEMQARSRAPLTVMYPGDGLENGRLLRAEASEAHYRKALEDTMAVASGRASREQIEDQLVVFLEDLRRRVPATLRRKAPRACIAFSDAPESLILDLGALTADFRPPGAEATPTEQAPLLYRLSTGTFLDAISPPWGWSDLQIGAKFRARVRPGFEEREYWFWIVPILGREGFLSLPPWWLLRPRGLQILWGRRREALDYARHALSGSFMSRVVREKADYADAGARRLGS